MVFPSRAPGHVTNLELHKPHPLGTANQKAYGYGPDGQNDKVVDHINDKLSHACKDSSFWHTQWSSNAPVSKPTRLPGQDEPVVAAPAQSLLPEILTILGVALVAAILAYVRPDLFASLFRIVVGYEVLVLLVGAALVLALLVVFLMGYHKK